MDEQEQQQPQNEVQEEQNVQMEPTPLSTPPSHKKLIIGIVAVFVLVVVGIAGAYFVLQPKTQPTEEENTEVANTIKVPGPLDDITFEEDQTMNDVVEVSKVGSNWKMYQNQSVGIKFNYPPNWNLPVPEEDLSGGDSFQTYYEIDNHEGDFYLSGVINKDVEEGGHGGSYGSCSFYIDTVDEFCEEGCTKVNEKTAYDYRFAFHGEGGISALAYTKESSEFSSICFEVPLGEIWEKILLDNIVYEDEQGNYDVEQYIEKSNLNENTLREINNFKTFVESIEKWTP